MIMAVQLTEFCPPRRRNERTNEVPRGIRNYFSQSNEQDAKLVLLFQGVYFFSFSFFFTGSQKGSSSLSRKHERE